MAAIIYNILHSHAVKYVIIFNYKLNTKQRYIKEQFC